MLEVHVALSREMFGPDVVASVTTSELRQLVDGIRFIETMRANPVDKDASAADTAPLRRLFTRSLVRARRCPRRRARGREHLAIKKPAPAFARAPRRVCRPTLRGRSTPISCSRPKTSKAS
jgi:N-acetylneuraminate synthase